MGQLRSWLAVSPSSQKRDKSAHRPLPVGTEDVMATGQQVPTLRSTASTFAESSLKQRRERKLRIFLKWTSSSVTPLTSGRSSEEWRRVSLGKHNPANVVRKGWEVSPDSDGVLSFLKCSKVRRWWVAPTTREDEHERTKTVLSSSCCCIPGQLGGRSLRAAQQSRVSGASL